MGAATVDRLVADGWSVVATDVCADEPAVPYPMATRAELDAVVARHGDRVRGRVADVRDQAALDAAVADAVEHFGRLDAAVAVAGVFRAQTPLWEVDDEHWDAVVDIDLRGVFHTLRAAVPAILATPEPRRGRIVTVSSTAGTIGLERMAPYVAAKHGVIGLTKAAAVDLAGTGVTANVVAPGSTRTAILEASAAAYDTPLESFSGHQRPLGRLIEPDEVAAAIAFLCSEAAAALTGAVVPVDGGMTATT